VATDSETVTALVLVCYYRQSVGQSVLEQSNHLGLTTRFLLLSDSCWVVDVVRSLCREDRSVVYNFCWPSPAQSFSGPSRVGLAIIYYCLRFETSLFIASYDSQSYGGGIRHRLHTGSECSKDKRCNITNIGSDDDVVASS
jgi:hypothetical protein